MTHFILDYNDIENPLHEMIEITEMPSTHLLSDSGISVTTTGTRPEQEISECLSHSSDKTEDRLVVFSVYSGFLHQ
jgi:mRNA degradation ribonuclease J1/J2